MVGSTVYISFLESFTVECSSAHQNFVHELADLYFDKKKKKFMLGNRNFRHTGKPLPSSGPVVVVVFPLFSFVLFYNPPIGREVGF